MKNKLSAILFVVFSSLFFLACENRNGFTDKTEAKNELVNGIKEGKWIQYLDSAFNYTSDSIIAKSYMLTIYIKGEPTGIVRIYYKSGKLEGERTYSDKEYYKNGNIKEEANFKDTKLNGEDKEYFEDGKLKSDKTYINDSLKR